MDVVNIIPKDRLLIESDGPYSKVNGKKFSPTLLLEEYELIAKSLNEPELIILKICCLQNKRTVLTHVSIRGKLWNIRRR